jgi:hypothetical protein
VLRTGMTFECDNCGKVQHVDPREFTPYGDPDAILAEQYGWLVVPNPARKVLDKHYCPLCNAAGCTGDER